MKTPRRLYKYRAFSDRTLSSLVEDQLFFADPSTFNDPLDTKPGVEIDLAEDQLETMLAAQMAAVHNATMTFARRLAHVENIQQQDSASRAFNQLARTFTAQMDALKRHRSSGQQVVVKHVTVENGGQAIVGNVETGGRGAGEN